jgi:hypothetical protein
MAILGRISFRPRHLLMISDLLVHQLVTATPLDRCGDR